MKKIIFVFVLGFAMVANAKPITNTSLTSLTSENSTAVVTLAEVNTFCKLIQQGNYDAVKSMIQAGVDVNKKSVGRSPLMYAARHNKVEIAKLLIANGADLKSRSDKGFTALQIAKMSKAHGVYEVITTALEELKAAKKKKSYLR